MKNLFEAATAKETQERIARLCPTSERQWGKMNAAQAVAHCSVAMEWAVGDRVEPRMFFGADLWADREVAGVEGRETDGAECAYGEELGGEG
jgi:hypothetical protein